MSFHLGLTGSIGMGKSTTAKMFADEGCAVWDADAAVHRLYQQNGAAVEPMKRVFPEAIVDNEVSRERLKKIIMQDPSALPRIEALVHPLVVKDRQNFIDLQKADILVFDIPLLFETGGQAQMDAVACVFVDADTQRDRVLERGTMTAQQFETILAKQMPISEKLALSDFKIVTNSMDEARQQVQKIVAEIRSKLNA